MGKCSLRQGTVGAGSGVTGLGTRLELWDSQALGHPATAGSCRRVENRVGGLQAASSLGPGGKGELGLVPVGSILGLTAVVNLVAAVTRNAKRPLQETRLWLCRQRSSPWLPMADPDVKRQLVFLTSLLSWQKLDV